MQPLGLHHMLGDQRAQRLGRHRDRAHPVAQGRDIQIDPFLGEHRALAGQRQMKPELADRDLGQKMRAGAATRNGMERRWCLGDRLARRTAELLAHRLQHDPTCAGMRSRVSLTTSPSLRKLPPQQPHEVGPGMTTRRRGRCPGKGLRAGLARFNSSTVHWGASGAAAASFASASASR